MAAGCLRCLGFERFQGGFKEFGGFTAMRVLGFG